MNFTSHDDYFAHLPKDHQDKITAKAEKLKQVYELSQIRLNDDEWQRAIDMLDTPQNPHKAMQGLFDRGFVCAEIKEK